MGMFISRFFVEIFVNGIGGFEVNVLVCGFIFGVFKGEVEDGFVLFDGIFVFLFVF